LHSGQVGRGLRDALRRPGEVAHAAGRRGREVHAVDEDSTARGPPVLRADPRRGDTGPGKGESIHVEVPCVQGEADDGDGVAHGRARMEHARVTPVGRR
ncbi:MAG: hypothetical protein ACK55Z_22625, partial [bacterium]